ncbi:pyruvate, phosphate dikinase, partial [bacterium]|nr:pyruvate, phosphate dikinase [bacterium]
MEIPVLPLTKQDWNQDILPNLLRTMWQFRQYRRRAAQFLKQNRQHCANLRGKIRQTTTKTGLLDLWEKEILPAYRDSMFHIVASGSDAQVRLERDLRSLVGAEDANALLSNLGGKSGKLESLGPMVGIGMVLRGEMSREDYLERYGHRGVNEGEAAWPRPEEDPNWLERQMNEWKHSPVDVEAMLMRQRAAYDAAWERFSRQYPRKVKSIQNRLKQAARSAQLREQVRSEGTRGMTVLRAFALHAGKLLDIGEDIFFLTIDETLAGLAGDLSAVQHIPVRKDVHARYQALPPYPAIICGRFDPFAWAADPNRRSDVFDSLQAAPPSAEVDMNVIRGAAGALGVVEGTVRRLDRIEDSHQF